jgi:ArsR family transcriptional regulator, arsenate/arsenite/antimonite-responsive transcriptional repressor
MFSQEVNMKSESIFKALADPTRRKIIALLRQYGSRNAGQIFDCFDITRPAISEHLNILRNAGLVYSEKQGQFVVYYLNTSVLEDLLTRFWSILEGGSHETLE